MFRRFSARPGPAKERHAPMLANGPGRPLGLRSFASVLRSFCLRARAVGAVARCSLDLTPLLVVQERRRLYRESMTACLKRQLDAFDVIEGVADAAGLLRLAESRHLDHAVIEVDGVPWDVARLVRSLRCHNSSVRVIGLATSVRSSAATEGVRMLSRFAGPDQVADLVAPGHASEAPFVLTSSPAGASSPLSGQQLRVLALLSLGMTVADVAARLSLSERAVAKAKVAIFSRLGVQSQAHAVASALAAGWLGPAAVVTGEDP